MDQLAAMGWSIGRVNNGSAPRFCEHYANVASEMWFEGAMQIQRREIILPTDDDLRGQLLVMGVMALFYSAGLALFGLDLAFPIGLFTGLAMFVPYLGFGLGLVLALLVAMLLEAEPRQPLVVMAV
jgi:hypothetical protein